MWFWRGVVGLYGWELIFFDEVSVMLLCFFVCISCLRCIWLKIFCFGLMGDF